MRPSVSTLLPSCCRCCRRASRCLLRPRLVLCNQPLYFERARLVYITFFSWSLSFCGVLS